MKRKREREGERVSKEEVEDWCFICKDGGSLIICDYPGCLKVYHPGCAGRKKCSIDSNKRWTCRRHSCTFCLGTPRFSCFLCPNSVCRHCIRGSEFMLLRGNNGFCKNCLKLVLLAEENSRYGFNGEEIDFNDRDTFECLFKEYWEIIKENEGLTLDDVCSANLRLEKGENEDCMFDSVKDGESEECVDLTKADNDSDNTILQKPMMAERKAPKAQEYVGWGSKPLIEFLRSIGKDTTERLSQLDVDSIIDDYSKERNLFHPTKKRRIICDDRLHAIFRRKSLDRFKKYGLLEKHIIQDLVSSDEDCNDEDDAENNKDTLVGSKKEKLGSDISCEKEVSPRVQLSGFASVISKNLKLVYLRKSLVEELLRQPAKSESKVLGSFVRVKHDPGDFLQRNSHQLLQIEGIVKVSPRKEMNSGFLLQVSNSKREIPTFQLSDADFTEEECEELRQNVTNGLLKKPTVVELEQKARDLHEDITKHWIQRELVRLQNSIDQANLKGWRRELLEFLDQRERLKQPYEQERLLENVPKVIGEVLEAESDTPNEVH